MRNTYLTEKYLDSSDQKYFAWRAGPDRARGLGAGLARSSPAPCLGLRRLQRCCPRPGEEGGEGQLQW